MIVQTAAGFVSLSPMPEAEYQVWSGPVFLGIQNPGNTALPLHAMANNISALKRFGMHLVNPGTREKVSLDVTPFLEQYCADDNLLETLQSMTGPGRWALYRLLRDTDGRMLAEVGIVLPRDFAGVPFTINCEGVPITDVQYVPDPHFGYSHWFMPYACVVQVNARFPLNDHGEYITFTLDFNGALPDDVAAAYRPLECFLNVKLLKGLPDLKRIKRVAGPGANANGFLNGGRNASKRILDIANTYGKDLNAPQSILDWGVGCGRVAMHMAKHSNFSVSGTDIDEDNANWCAQNLKGNFVKTDLMPPSLLPSETFDIIYSCSVLSHLTEPVVDAWLEELSRVMKPDGLAILSFNGSGNLAGYLGKRPFDLRQVLGKEMFVGDINHDLDGFIPSSDYYRASFSEDWWWKDKFAQFFKIAGVEAAVVSGYQDMAVLQKR